MKVYHTYERSMGFDLNKMDYERGIFAIKPWWANDPKYEKYSIWTPNEFGDTVVELEVDDNAKTYTMSNQADFLEKNFPNSSTAKNILDKFEKGDFDRTDWHMLDKFIGRYLRKKGYKMIHYTDDEMYGDAWAILNKNIIKGVKFPPNKKP